MTEESPRTAEFAHLTHAEMMAVHGAQSEYAAGGSALALCGLVDRIIAGHKAAALREAADRFVADHPWEGLQYRVGHVHCDLLQYADDLSNPPGAPGADDA